MKIKLHGKRKIVKNPQSCYLDHSHLEPLEDSGMKLHTQKLNQHEFSFKLELKTVQKLLPYFINIVQEHIETLFCYNLRPFQIA